MKREHCWRPLCLIGMGGCQTEWLGDELWAVCARCGKRRIYLDSIENAVNGLAEVAASASPNNRLDWQGPVFHASELRSVECPTIETKRPEIFADERA